MRFLVCARLQFGNRIIDAPKNATYSKYFIGLNINDYCKAVFQYLFVQFINLILIETYFHPFPKGEAM